MNGFRRKIMQLCAVMPLLLSCVGCADLLNLSEQAPSDLSVQKLIALQSRATDPKKEYHNCKSYRMLQTLSVLDGKTKDELAIELCFQTPDKIRTTTFRGGQAVTVEVYNGGKAWTIDCGTGRIRRVPSGLPLELFRIFTRMATPSMDATRIFKKVTADMNVDEKGYKTYRLICDAGVDGIAPYVFYINGQTFLEERMETIRYGTFSEDLYVSTPADYRWYGNVRLPVISTVRVKDSTRISRMTHFEMNVDFPDHYFKPELRNRRILLPSPPPAGKKNSSGKKAPAVKNNIKK